MTNRICITIIESGNTEYYDKQALAYKGDDVEIFVKPLYLEFGMALTKETFLA